jgi:hypothetical protein
VFISSGMGDVGSFGHQDFNSFGFLLHFKFVPHSDRQNPS